MDTHDRLKYKIGTLVVNLWTLESALRLVRLMRRQSNDRPTDLHRYFDLREGDIVDEDAFTGHESLGTLIDAFNGSGLSPERIDRDVAALSDLLARGRPASADDDRELKVLTFSYPISGKVRVTDSKQLSGSWLDVQIDRTARQCEIAIAALERLDS